MRVSFMDPQGPRHWRMLPYLAPLLGLAFAVFGPLSMAGGGYVAMGAIALFTLLGLVSFAQRVPRTAELAFGPGYVDVKHAGTRNRRIRAKDVTGGTSARTRNGFIFTLQLRDRDQPVTLEVEKEEDLVKIRQALGVGHGGFGTVAWRTRGDSNMSTAYIGRLIAFVAALIPIAVGLFGGDPATALGAGLLAGAPGSIGLLIAMVGLFSRPGDPTIVMAPDGLRLKSQLGWFSLPYFMLDRLEEHKRGVVFHLPPPHPRVSVERSGPTLGGLSDAAVKTISAQILSASQRARGMGPRKEDVTGRVDILRREGESLRDWLVRLDMAGQTLSASGAYRGNSVDAEDLWAILEDPEAEPELRAGAARVLRHSPAPETRVRIDAAVAAVRDEAANQRLRIAIRDDLDGASQELAYLDASERNQRAAQIGPYAYMPMSAPPRRM